MHLSLEFRAEDVTYVDYYEGGDNVIRLDLERTLPLDSDVYGNVIMFNTLEHIQNSQKLLNESFRITKSGGGVHGVVPFLYPYHADPHDYFRYTHESLEIMLSRAGYERISIERVGVGSFTCAANICSWALKIKPLVFLTWIAAIYIDKILNRLSSRNQNYYIALAFHAVKK